MNARIITSYEMVILSEKYNPNEWKSEKKKLTQSIFKP